MKVIWNKFVDIMFYLVESIINFKTWVYEYANLARLSNRKLLQTVKLTSEQKKEIRSYWKKHYGKRIPLFWHRLNQAYSGCYCKEYFPEVLYSTKLERRLVPYFSAKVLADKSLLNVLFDDSIMKKPETVFFKSKGNYFDKEWNMITEKQAVAMLNEKERIVYKPSRYTGEGRGVIIAAINQGMVGNLGISVKQLVGQGKDYIVQLPLEQSSALSVLYGSAVNTIRLVTYTANEKIHCAKPILRIGTGGNSVDSVGQGGIFIGVDEGGNLHPVAYSLKGSRYTHHPDSGVRFAGYKIPKIAEMMAAAIKLHGRVSRCEMISWDFTLDKADTIVLIEMNLKIQTICYTQICHGCGIFEENTEYMMQRMKEGQLIKAGFC